LRKPRAQQLPLLVASAMWTFVQSLSWKENIRPNTFNNWRERKCVHNNSSVVPLVGWLMGNNNLCLLCVCGYRRYKQPKELVGKVPNGQQKNDLEN
jgi:hypothetical protein